LFESDLLMKYQLFSIFFFIDLSCGYVAKQLEKRDFEITEPDGIIEPGGIIDPDGITDPGGITDHGGITDPNGIGAKRQILNRNIDEKLEKHYFEITEPDGILEPGGIIDPDGITDPGGITDQGGITDPNGIGTKRQILNRNDAKLEKHYFEITEPDGITEPVRIIEPDGITDPGGITAPDGITDPNSITDSGDLGIVSRDSEDDWENGTEGSPGLVEGHEIQKTLVGGHGLVDLSSPGSAMLFWHHLHHKKMADEIKTGAAVAQSRRSFHHLGSIRVA